MCVVICTTQTMDRMHAHKFNPMQATRCMNLLDCAKCDRRARTAHCRPHASRRSSFFFRAHPIATRQARLASCDGPSARHPPRFRKKRQAIKNMHIVRTGHKRRPSALDARFSCVGRLRVGRFPFLFGRPPKKTKDKSCLFGHFIKKDAIGVSCTNRECPPQGWCLNRKSKGRLVLSNNRLCVHR